MGKATKKRYTRLTLLAGIVLLSAGLVASGLPGSGHAPQEHHRGHRKPASAGAPHPTPIASSITGAAYSSVAPELPGLLPGGVYGARQSVIDPRWASVRVSADRPDGYYAVFLHREGGLWHARRSVLVQRNPDPEKGNPRDIEAVLGSVPEDLKRPLLARGPQPRPTKPGEAAIRALERALPKSRWEVISTHASGPYRVVRLAEVEGGRSTRVYLERSRGVWKVLGIGENLTEADLPGFPKDLVASAPPLSPEKARVEPARPVFTGHPDRERIMPGLERALRYVRRYPGIAGFYVIDLENGSGYGIRPDEPFFSASVIKVAVMVAVFRRMDEGRLSYGEELAITREDKAPGAGGLRWEPVGTKLPVRDYLWLMITRSDNVATNVLTRAVGGRGYVNRVARSLGARHTVLYQKLSDNRAAVPALDNRTTPRDMATILAEIYEGRAASRESCRRMIQLLRHNDMEWWMEAGVPPSVKVANKGGWLDSTFNDAGIVLYRKHPYVLAEFTKYGTNDLGRGGAFLADVSKVVWRAESGVSLAAYEKQRSSDGRTTSSPSR
ncbi:MAG: class A beta-lactamase-related serine hydrolase [Rubrobacteraceae bacterium]|nr:class A beta-lactamase-related serine hydrolase [Rubrobacteraceae bacterium]